MSVDEKRVNTTIGSEQVKSVHSHAPWNNRTYRSYFLALLVISYTVNFMDRQLLSILLEPIKHDLNLADWQLGALGGITFALFYVTLGLPIAKLSDRYNRLNILTIAITCWSVATAACGLATNFLQMMFARIGVAVGESAGTPPSYSMISDVYPPEKRATATGIYLTGTSIGTGLGLLVGGWASQIWGWRAAFFIVAVPGVLLAVLMKLTLKEPPRGLSENRVPEGEASTVLGVVRLLSTRTTFLAMAVASGIAAFSGYAMALWLPSFFIRSHGLSIGEAGTWLALANIVSGIIGAILGGMAADKLGKNNRRWLVLVPCCAMMLSAPLAYFSFTIGSTLIALIGTTVTLTLYHSWAPPIYAAAQNMVGLRMRAVTVSLLLFCINLIGLGFGPPVIGAISDYFNQTVGSESLRYALMLTGPIFGVSGALFYIASRTLERDLDQAPD